MKSSLVPRVRASCVEIVLRMSILPTRPGGDCRCVETLPIGSLGSHHMPSIAAQHCRPAFPPLPPAPRPVLPIMPAHHARPSCPPIMPAHQRPSCLPINAHHKRTTSPLDTPSIADFHTSLIAGIELPAVCFPYPSSFRIPAATSHPRIPKRYSIFPLTKRHWCC